MQRIKSVQFKYSLPQAKLDTLSISESSKTSCCPLFRFLMKTMLSAKCKVKRWVKLPSEKDHITRQSALTEQTTQLSAIVKGRNELTTYILLDKWNYKTSWTEIHWSRQNLIREYVKGEIYSVNLVASGPMELKRQWDWNVALISNLWLRNIKRRGWNWFIGIIGFFL